MVLFVAAAEAAYRIVTFDATPPADWNVIQLIEDAPTIEGARAAPSADAHEQAAIAFALALVDARGRVSAQRLAEARAAGLDDTDLVEIAAVVAAMTFSNYVNIMADTEIDLPLAPNLPRID